MAPPIVAGAPVVLKINRLDLGLRRGQFARVLVARPDRVEVECLGEDGRTHATLEVPVEGLIAVVCEPLPESDIHRCRVPMQETRPEGESLGVVGALAVILGVSRQARIRA